ncbi:hypothetical protein ATCVOR07043_525L [Acanthocystis turfacea Chlorella virus OR0704.3]|nr:hypothetical protein ATCVOR07043_525L [Acanthocystis turfacea Chlorella virus OR0704.3]
MTTLQYYWDDGTHTVFEDYTIDKHSVVKNKSGHVLSQHKTPEGYYRISVNYERKQRHIYAHRALASTFLGPPPTFGHTADHDNRDCENNTLKNILWKDKSEQAKNRKRPTKYNTAFIIVKGGVELTAKEWVKVYKKPDGEKYTETAIQQYARAQKHGFQYKAFPDLRGEVWKAVPISKNSRGKWFISNKNRVKYKTQYAENILIVDQLTKVGGYPGVHVNGKRWSCHELSMMTFRPQEYAAKLPGDKILHKHDDKNDFNPFRLRWGTPPENGKDAHKNGKFIGKKTAQKPVVSYINNVFEKEHASLGDAVRYLQVNGYPGAYHKAVKRASENDTDKYDRTWKFV